MYVQKVAKKTVPQYWAYPGINWNHILSYFKVTRIFIIKIITLLTLQYLADDQKYVANITNKNTQMAMVIRPTKGILYLLLKSKMY